MFVRYRAEAACQGCRCTQPGVYSIHHNASGPRKGCYCYPLCLAPFCVVHKASCEKQDQGQQGGAQGGASGQQGGGGVGQGQGGQQGSTWTRRGRLPRARLKNKGGGTPGQAGGQGGLGFGGGGVGGFGQGGFTPGAAGQAGAGGSQPPPGAGFARRPRRGGPEMFRNWPQNRGTFPNRGFARSRSRGLLFSFPPMARQSGPRARVLFPLQFRAPAQQSFGMGSTFMPVPLAAIGALLARGRRS